MKFIAIFFFLAGAPGLAPGKSIGELKPFTDLLCDRFVDLISREDYEGAIKIADSLIQHDPEPLGGYFLKLTALNNRSIDFEDDEDIPALLAIADSVKNISERRISSGDKSALIRFYRGSVEGFLMVHDLRLQNFIDAILHGQRAADYLEQALAIDSTLYDAYVGLGNYYYFKSSYSGVLRSTGIVTDRREEGKRLLRIAVEKGSLTRLAAISSLAWIAIDEKDYDEAIKRARELIALYPNNRAFYWCLGRAQKMSEKWNDVIDTYSILLNSVRNNNRNNHYNEIGCLYSIALAYHHLADWQNVVRVADEALSLKIDAKVAESKSDDLKRLQKLRLESRKNLGINNSE